MRSPTLTLLAVLAAAVALVVPAVAATEGSLEDQLEAARERRASVEARLATEAGDLEGLEEQLHVVEEELAGLDERDRELRSDLARIEDSLAARSRMVFMRGDTSPLQVILSSGDFSDAADAVAMLESLALRDRATLEDAMALRTQLAVNREQREDRRAALDELQTNLQAQVEQLAADLEQLQRDEERFGEQLRQQREEERRQREAEERRKREAEAASAPAPSGNLACPVGDPVYFSDTWGAPRSGGRSHQGVDMMAPHGTPVYAITSGKITRLTSSSLGGISLYMYGDDGNEYFYTHLQGYASGVSSGMRVEAGTLVAYNGSTGNASSSAPHVHFEVHPGGGGAVNPYPYAARACGR